MTVLFSTLVTPEIPGRFLQVAIPLNRGTWTWSAGISPFKVVDASGRTLVHQVERIERHGDGSASDVFVIADCGVDPSPPFLISFDKNDMTRESAQRKFKYSPEARSLSDDLPIVPESQPLMAGPVCMQYRLHYPGLEGVVTFFHECPSVRVDVIRHNAHPNAKDEELNWLETIPAPDGWTAEYTIPEPIGSENGDLVDGTPHLWPQRQMREIAMVWRHSTDPTRDAHFDSGLAIASDLWRQHAAWAPHMLPCADLAFMHTGARGEILADHARIENALLAGTQYPPPPYNYPKSQRWGFLHLGYDQTAGATGGPGIAFGPSDIPSIGTVYGVRWAMMESRMRNDRNRFGAITPEGEPFTYEMLRPEIDSEQIRFASDNPGHFDKSGAKVLDGSLGWSLQQPVPVTPEVSAIKSYATTDWGHECRWSQYDHVALQLANRWPARYRLRMRGELARMALHSDQRITQLHGWSMQAIGLSSDRVLGWQLNALATAYALGNNNLRTRFHEDISHLLWIGEWATVQGTPASALTQGKQASADPPYRSLYGVTCSIHVSLLEQGFYACAAVTDGSLANFPQSAALRAWKAVEFLRDGANTVWSAATYLKSTKERYATRQPGLDSTVSGFDAGSSHDSAQTTGLLAFLGHEMLRGEGPGHPLWAGWLATVKAMLGNTPKAKLRSRALKLLGSSDLALLAVLDEAGLP